MHVVVIGGHLVNARLNLPCVSKFRGGITGLVNVMITSLFRVVNSEGEWLKVVHTIHALLGVPHLGLFQTFLFVHVNIILV